MKSSTLFYSIIISATLHVIFYKSFGKAYFVMVLLIIIIVGAYLAVKALKKIK